MTRSDFFRSALAVIAGAFVPWLRKPYAESLDPLTSANQTSVGLVTPRTPGARECCICWNGIDVTANAEAANDIEGWVDIFEIHPYAKGTCKRIRLIGDDHPHGKGRKVARRRIHGRVEIYLPVPYSVEAGKGKARFIEGRGYEIGIDSQGLDSLNTAVDRLAEKLSV
jgi:hypothetical protein